MVGMSHGLAIYLTHPAQSQNPVQERLLLQERLV